MIERPTLSLLALAFLVACGSKEHEETGAAASASAAHHKPAPGASAPATPSSTATAAPKEVAAAHKWLAGVPAKHAAVKPGEHVWAVTPDTAPETVLFGVVEVDSLQGDSLTTVGLVRTGGKLAKDPSAAKHPSVPGALVSAAPTVEASKVKKGEIVIAPVVGYRATAGHVVKLEAGGAEIKYVNGDKVKEEVIDYAMPLAKGIAPFAYVAVKNGATYKEVLVAAVIDDQVFGVDDAGNFHKAAKADVKPLDVAWKERKKGDKVVAFDAGGSAETTIETVSVDKWVYKVKINGAEKHVPFYAIVDKM